MKIRYGFVSNSSSSSYVCEVCGNAKSGWDASAADCGMFTCRDHTHIFCEDHAIGGIKRVDLEDGDNTVDSENCPLCQLEEVSTFDQLRYIQCFHSRFIKDEIRSKFKNYNELDKFIRENHNFATKV